MKAGEIAERMAGKSSLRDRVLAGLERADRLPAIWRNVSGPSEALLQACIDTAKEQAMEHRPGTFGICLGPHAADNDQHGTAMRDCPVIAQWAEVLRAAGFLEEER